MVLDYSWLELCFVICGLVGVVNILTRSYLFESFRNSVPTARLRYFVNCPQCMGFWVGFLYYIFRCGLKCGLVDFLFYSFLWGGAISLLSSATVAVLDYISFAKSLLLERMTISAAEEMVQEPTTEETQE